MSLKTKTELMALVIAGKNRECFEHSHFGMMDVTAMRTIVLSGRAYDYVFVPLHLICDHIRETRVIDKERITTLPAESWQKDPAIFIISPAPHLPGGWEHTMVDGHHRALRREAEGLQDIRAAFIHERDIIRPPEGWGLRADMDWGDALVDGKIVKRT